MSKKTTPQPQPAVQPPPFQKPYEVATLSRARTREFDLSPDSEEAVKIAAFLKIPQVSQLRFKGGISAEGDEDWRIDGRLTASVTQDCVVTLAPVDEKIDEKVVRIYVPEEEEAAILAEQDIDPDADDEPSGFTDTIDPGQLAIEALSLALDPYPRSKDAELEEARFAAPGVEPLSDNDLKPFAGLAALKEKMERGEK